MHRLTFFCACALVALADCGSDNVSVTLPNMLTATPPELAFDAVGSTLKFVADESGGYTGAIKAESTDCDGIATFTPTSGTGPSFVIAVSSVSAGQCFIKITDAGSRHDTTVVVDVTTTTATAQ